MALQVLAQPDQTFARPDQGAQPVGSFAPDVYGGLNGPIGAASIPFFRSFFPGSAP